MGNKITYLFPKTKQLLEERGYHVEKLEYWLPYPKNTQDKNGNDFSVPGVRKDAFNIIDGMAINPEFVGTLFFQLTTASNTSARRKKCEKMKYKRKDGTEVLVLPDILRSHNRFYIFGWRKNPKNRWVLNEEEAVLCEDGEIRWNRVLPIQMEQHWKSSILEEAF